MKKIALIGPTASGKSGLALYLAQKFDAYILSLDSLSVYKEIDIVSAKPTKEELRVVRHFGIDEIYPNEHFSAGLFFNLYNQSINACQNANKNLIIVGGTGFYLHALIDGLSETPAISLMSKQMAENELIDIEKAYKKLQEIDYDYSIKISQNDNYRIQKALELFFETSKKPTILFEENKKKALCPDVDIFEIAVDRAILRDQIKIRTQNMIKAGLIDEIRALKNKYGIEPKCMKSIGIAETLEYLDEKITLNEMTELISIHTGQLAKRQETFNKSKFKHSIKLPINELQTKLEFFFKN